MNIELKECLRCGKKVKGRADKKFCSDLCRTKYHNEGREGNTVYVRRVNYILNRNRKILASWDHMEEKKIRKDLLEEQGFDFSYFTHIHTVNEDENHYYCYDYGYCPLNSNLLMLLRKKDDGGYRL